MRQTVITGAMVLDH